MIFLQDVILYLRLICKSPQHYQHFFIATDSTLEQNVVPKIIIPHFQNWNIDSRTRLQKDFLKTITILKIQSWLGFVGLQSFMNTVIWCPGHFWVKV